MNQKPEENKRQLKPVRCGFIASINGCTYGAPAPTMPALASLKQTCRKKPKET